MKSEYKNLIGLLGQAPLGEVSEVFDDFIRGTVRTMVVDIMASEVEELCGPRYHPNPSDNCRRAGSAQGSYVQGARVDSIQRPRVRSKLADGKEQEVGLISYAAARDESSLQDALMRALIGGVSSRDQQSLYPEAKHASKSSVSRLWVERGAAIFEELRTRDLGDERWLALMLDGIGLGSNLTAIVALGITEDGRKIILDFEVGSSENYEVAHDLLNRIEERGFKPSSRRLLVVLDGGKGLCKAVKACFKGRLVLQRCLVHKERNIRGYLGRQHHGKLSELFNKLRNSQGIKDATKALEDVRDFLTKKSKRSLESLEEAGDELLAFHRLGVPSTLNVSLLSTNCIENSFKNVRRKIDRVNRWRTETDQPQRWLAYALSVAQKGFRRIKGWRDLEALKEALNRESDEIIVPIISHEVIDRESVLL